MTAKKIYALAYEELLSNIKCAEISDITLEGMSEKEINAFF